MPFVLLHNYFSELAERETRTLMIPEPGVEDLPAGSYSFLEMFCDEPECDCRRVLFHVLSSVTQDFVATISYGWEDPSFYSKWIGFDNPEMLAAMKGPALNIGSPQSELAPMLLEAVRDLLLPDPAYIERVKRHYSLFREKIGGKKPAALRRRRLDSKAARKKAARKKAARRKREAGRPSHRISAMRTGKRRCAFHRIKTPGWAASCILTASSLKLHRDRLRLVRAERLNSAKRLASGSFAYDNRVRALGEHFRAELAA